jgi:glutaredoxin
MKRRGKFNYDDEEERKKPPTNLDLIRDITQEDIIRNITSNPNKFVIFHDACCIYSQQARILLIRSGYPFVTYNIEKIASAGRYTNGDPLPPGMLSLLSTLNFYAQQLRFDPNHTTKPVIFYNGQFIGGYTELINFINPPAQKY